MKRINIQWIGSFILIIIAITGFSCAHGNQEKKDTAINQADHEKIMEQFKKGVEESKKIVVARVNGSDITMMQLISAMNQIAPNYIKDPREKTPELNKKVEKDALDLLIFRELAIQEATRRGMKVDPKRVDQALKNFIHIMGSEEAYNYYMLQRGLDEKTMIKELERDELVNMISREEIMPKVKENEDKAQAIQERKQEWEAELKKDAKIEITLDEVEKKLKEEADKKKSQ